MADSKKPEPGKTAPWETKAPRKPAPTISKDRLLDGPTQFVGSPTKPTGRPSSMQLVHSHHAHVTITGGPMQGTQVPVDGDRLLLGREAPADVVVDDPAASRRHAQIYRRDGKWLLKDLGSTNGTWFEGLLAGSERALRDGAVFKIGDWEFTFSDPASAK
jgi:hypothetical protein